MAEFKLLGFIVIMLGINLVLGLANNAVSAINPGAGFGFNASSSPMATFTYSEELDGGLSATSEDVDFLTSDSIEADTGVIYTDNTKSTRNWFKSLDDRFTVVKSVLSQPAGFLKDIGVPLPIATGIGIIWYLVLAILFVSFIKGGDAN